MPTLRSILVQQTKLKAINGWLKLIANKNVDPNIQDKKGQTALMHAVRNNSIGVVILLLTHAKIDLDIKNKDGKTASDMAQTNEMKQLFTRN